MSTSILSDKSHQPSNSGVSNNINSHHFLSHQIGLSTPPHTSAASLGNSGAMSTRVLHTNTNSNEVIMQSNLSNSIASVPIASQNLSSSRNTSEQEKVMQNYFSENQRFYSGLPSRQFLTNNSQQQQNTQYPPNTSLLTASTLSEDKSNVSYSNNKNAFDIHGLTANTHQYGKLLTTGQKQLSSGQQSVWSSGQASCHEMSQLFNFSPNTGGLFANSIGMITSTAINANQVINSNNNNNIDEESTLAIAAVGGPPATATANTSCSFEPNKSLNTTGMPTCPQHHNKKVKYEMTHDDSVKFCSTCAVEYAQQGYAIQEITKQQQKEMDCFLAELSQVKAANSALMIQLESALSNIKQHCLKQTDFIHELFLCLERMLFDEKTKALSSINERMWACMHELEQRKNDLRMEEKRFKRNESDISRNAAKIVAEMEVDEVREILASYKEELAATRQKIDAIYADTSSFELVKYDAIAMQSDLSVLKSQLQQQLFKPTKCVIDACKQAQQQQQQQQQQNQQQSHQFQSSTTVESGQQLSRLMSNYFEKKKNDGLTTPLSAKVSQKQQQQQLSNDYQEALKSVQISQLVQSSDLSSQQQIPYGLQTPQVSIATAPSTPTPNINNMNCNNQQDAAAQQQANMVEMSISEKQQTQESDDVSSVQGNPAVVESSGNRMIMNKSTMNSSHKIISYADIHENGITHRQKSTAVPTNTNSTSSSSSSNNNNNNNYNNRLIVKPATELKLNNNNSYGVLSEKKPVLSQQLQTMFASPSQAGGVKSQGSQQSQYQMKENVHLMNSVAATGKYKQTSSSSLLNYANVQTEPSHLQASKVSKGLGSASGKTGGFQRNLMMNDEQIPQNKFKLNTPVNSAGYSHSNGYQQQQFFASGMKQINGNSTLNSLTTRSYANIGGGGTNGSVKSLGSEAAEKNMKGTLTNKQLNVSGITTTRTSR